MKTPFELMEMYFEIKKYDSNNRVANLGDSAMTQVIIDNKIAEFNQAYDNYHLQMIDNAIEQT